MARSQPPRKKFEADILEDWIAKQRLQRSSPGPRKARQPRVTPMASPRQRRALSQTKDPVRAAYGSEGKTNATPVRADLTGLTREVGPNDKHNDKDHRTGKDTSTRYPDSLRKKKPTTRRRPQPDPGPTGELPSLEEFIRNKGRL